MNPIVKKIVKLMKLAEDQVGTPEGETAARIAQKLITAHAVKQEQLREAGEEAEDKIVRLTGWKKCNNIWERYLWHVVSMYMNCTTWFNGFRRSAVQGLLCKLNALKHEARNEASTAIVLKNRYERVLESIADMNLQNSRNTRSRYSQNGYEAGRNINIKAGINANNNRRLA